MRLSGQVPRLAVGSGGMPGGGKAAVAFRHPHGAAIRGIGFKPKRAMPRAGQSALPPAAAREPSMT